MTTRTVLLALHIASVSAWLGANFAQLALNPQMSKGSPEVAIGWSRAQMWLGQRYYGAVGGLIAITGVLLVLDGDWSWSSWFIWVGVTVIVIGAALGVAAFTPVMERRVAALESGDQAAAATAQSTVIKLALLDTALVLLAILAMVHKWHTG
jgi:hypothetical protein